MLRTKFCSTGVPTDTRNDISNKLAKMGAIHEVNLLSDVKYLIVGARDTDKYRYCLRKRYDIKFIQPQDVFLMFEKWLNNENVNLNEYQMPVFANLKICLSRLKIDDLIKSYFNTEDVMKLESIINSLVTSNGGEICTSLNFGNSCVITNDLNGKKFDMAKVWKIPVIHPIWIIYSLRRNACFEFKDFDSESEQFDSVINELWSELKKKRTREIFESDNKDNYDEEKRELVIKRKNPKIWDSIMSNPTVNNNNVRKNEWDDDVDQDDPVHVKPNPFNSISIPHVSKSSILNPDNNAENKSDLFQNRKFFIKFFEFKKLNILKKVIKSHNGLIVDELSHDLDFLIIPSTHEISDIPYEYKKYLIMTEWFIERSLFYSKIKIDQWGKPFYKKLNKNLVNLPNDGLNVSITGFQGIELLHITKMINILMQSDDERKPSFNLLDSLNKNSDLLVLNIDLIKLSKKNDYLILKNPTLFNQVFNKDDICKSSLNSTKTKLNFAKFNNIPIVTISFLFEFFLRDESEEDLINVNFKDWCLYCPRMVNINPRISDLIISYDDDQDLPKTDVEKETGLLQKDSVILQKDDEEDELQNDMDSLPKLPSPIRNKRQNNNLRLIGRSKISHLDNNTESYNSNQDTSNNDIFETDELNDGDLRTTQISYENNENLFINDNSYKKRSTRGTYKQLMDLGNE